MKKWATFNLAIGLNYKIQCLYHFGNNFFLLLATWIHICISIILKTTFLTSKHVIWFIFVYWNQINLFMYLMPLSVISNSGLFCIVSRIAFVNSVNVNGLLYFVINSCNFSLSLSSSFTSVFVKNSFKFFQLIFDFFYQNPFCFSKKWKNFSVSSIKSS